MKDKILKKWDCIWEIYYEKFKSLSLIRKITLSFLFALFTGVSGQLYINLPFTPVPLTLQVFTVLLAGILLGENFGALSQVFYFILGVSGIPWFAGSGVGFFRPTTGYILGFIFSAYFVGKYFHLKKSKLYSFLIMFAGVSIIYFLGCLYLSLFLNFDIKRSFLIGVLPFIPFDMIKIYFASLIGNSIIKHKKEFL